jgi:uncharacterized damage-inducible protein DinB
MSHARRAELIAEIERAPAILAAAVEGLSLAQLDVKYRNWTIRQIARHLVDSHIHSYVRFKWALTEEAPLIKAYDENLWATLPDSAQGDLAAPLTLCSGLHACWTQLLRAMTPEHFQRGFNHPETGKFVVLNDALSYYAWHGRHHAAQIAWLRGRHGW